MSVEASSRIRGVRSHLGPSLGSSSLVACRGGGHGAQVEPLQEGSIHVSLEVEEETHSPLAKEAPQDEAAVEVRGSAWRRALLVP